MKTSENAERKRCTDISIINRERRFRVEKRKEYNNLLSSDKYAYAYG